MKRPEVWQGAFWILLIVLLVVLTTMFPSNSLTGYVVEESPTCQDGSCVELCDVDGGSCASPDMVCCVTEWASGVCDYETNCGAVLAYSSHQSLEVYQDTVREEPAAVQGWTRFFFPIVITFMILIYFVFRRKDPHW